MSRHDACGNRSSVTATADSRIWAKDGINLVNDMKASGLDPFEANAGTFFHTVDKAREYTIKLKVQFAKVKLMSAIDS